MSKFRRVKIKRHPQKNLIRKLRPQKNLIRKLRPQKSLKLKLCPNRSFQKISASLCFRKGHSLPDLSVKQILVIIYSPPNDAILLKVFSFTLALPENFIHPGKVYYFTKLVSFELMNTTIPKLFKHCTAIIQHS